MARADAGRPDRPPWRPYALALLVIALSTGVALLMAPYFSPSNLIMVYLLGVVLVATRWGRGPSMVASLLSVAAFDFFLVPPYLTLAVADAQYLVIFAVMLVVALVISNLAAQVRQQAIAAGEREQRTAALYALSRELADRSGVAASLEVAVRHLGEVFDSQALILLPNATGRLVPQSVGADPSPLEAKEQGVAQWAYDHGQTCGLGTATLPEASVLYTPLNTAHGGIGVIALRPRRPGRIFEREQIHLLETFANQTALAVERAHLAEEAQKAQVQVETERLRSSLLSSISHDLRTPLAAITGSVSSLIEAGDTLDTETRGELMQSVYREISRLNQQVVKLLDMTRLESGSVDLHQEWYPLEELIGAALTRLDERLRGRPVLTRLPADLPWVQLDAVLIEQVLINLLENAVKYTPADSPIEISAYATEGEIQVEIADRGPGVPPGDEERIFEKFYRAGPAESGGVGLGLSICRAAVAAHGGRIWAENRERGGTRFTFTLPRQGQPPEVAPEPEEGRMATSEEGQRQAASG